MRASIAPVGVKCVMSVVPKHGSLCILFDLVSMILYELMGLAYCVISVIALYKLYLPLLEYRLVSEEIGCSKIICGERSINGMVSVLSDPIN